MIWGMVVIGGVLVLLVVAALGVRRYGQRHARLTRERLEGRHIAQIARRNHNNDSA